MVVGQVVAGEVGGHLKRRAHLDREEHEVDVDSCVVTVQIYVSTAVVLRVRSRSIMFHVC